MAEGLDKATHIWKGVFSEQQLAQLGLKKDGPKAKRPKRKDSGRSSEHSRDHGDPGEAIQLMARLLMRHEESLKVMLQESEFILHIAPGEGSILPFLIKCHQMWLAGPKETTLRSNMAMMVVATLAQRLDSLQKAPVTDALFQDCIKYHLINDQKEMPFLRWDSQQRKLMPTNSKGLQIGEVVNTLTNVIRIMKSEPGITLRFHALSKMPESEDHDRTLPFMWTVGHRSQGEIWNLLSTLAFHSCWQLVRVTMRPQDQRRSPLAQQVQRLT